MLDFKPKSTRIHDDIFYHMEIIMEKAADVCADLMRYIVNSENPEGPENVDVWKAYNKAWESRENVLHVKSKAELEIINNTVKDLKQYYNSLINQRDKTE